MKNKIGIAIVIIGMLHTCLAIFTFHEHFAAMLGEGLLSTGAGERRGWAFWFTFVGILLILFGLAIREIERLGGSAPSSIGWILLVSSIVGVIIYPISGFWLTLAVSVIIVFGQRKPA